MQKAYWKVLSGVTPVTGQRDELTHNEVQLISQLNWNGPSELSPIEEKGLGFYIPASASH